MSALLCTRQPALFDRVLFDDDVSEVERAEARVEAAALCAACLTPCGERVTADTTPRVVQVLPDGWLPPAREGVAVPEPRRVGPRRPREYVPPVGRDYVRPARRAAAWARMAHELADAGQSVGHIATELCVSEATVHRLLTGWTGAAA